MDSIAFRVPKTAELVAHRLRRQIISGELSEGDVLPSEAALTEQFGISRPTLREAFRVLEAEQLISVRRGAHGGAHVHAPNPDVAARYAGLVLEHQGISLADVYAARVMLESPCAAQLARRRTADDLAQLWHSVEDGEAFAGDRHRLIRHHTEFHALVVRLAGNHTVVLLSSMLRHIIDTANVRRVEHDARGPATDHAFEHGGRAHRRLVTYIDERDDVRAGALWAKHLAEANDFLLDLPTATTILDLLD
ncbi:MAG: GntR domain protein [Ilumatobacteraceae bacterium]|nr:GntR domain protein [Ilumatobacteraceae bacterium]MCU1389776.1 GntR domain protein [Ilumatobacteraceae bacterium]